MNIQENEYYKSIETNIILKCIKIDGTLFHMQVENYGDFLDDLTIFLVIFDDLNIIELNSALSGDWDFLNSLKHMKSYKTPLYKTLNT